jgi:hypothetical protein
MVPLLREEEISGDDNVVLSGGDEVGLSIPDAWFCGDSGAPMDQMVAEGDQGAQAVQARTPRPR